MRTRRVTLSALQGDSLGDSPPEWLAEAERSVLGAEPGCPLIDRLGAGDTGYWIRVARQTNDGRSERRTVGALTARLADDWLEWGWLAVDESLRAFGYGGAAVPIVERAARRLGATGARALVPESNGIALYFWLRLGYRPATRHEWPQPYAGTWMERGSI